MKPFSEEWISAYYDGILEFTELYKSWIQDEPEMADLAEFFEEFSRDVPLLKLDRWFGYAQGILIERGMTTTEIERARTRSTFRRLDFA